MIRPLLFHFILLIFPLYHQKIDIRLCDKVRIKEAHEIAVQFGDSIWKGYNSAPFPVLLVTENIEYLAFHPNPSNDFNYLVFDSILKSDVYYRSTIYSPNFLATFPAVNGISCIVVGTPEKTNRSSCNWIITILHEHFHQYQYSYDKYHTNVDALDLSKGDQTGMWMLNYNFPYDSTIVIECFKEYTNALAEVLIKREKKDFSEAYNKYLNRRNKLKTILNTDDYNYFLFQCWQEGIARYTEYKFLEKLIYYKPSTMLSKFDDYTPFSEIKKTMDSQLINDLLNFDIKENKRISFYLIGFAEGLLLDKIDKNWKERYLNEFINIYNFSSINEF